MTPTDETNGTKPDDVKELSAEAAGSLEDAYAALAGGPPGATPGATKEADLEAQPGLSLDDAIRQTTAEGLSRADSGLGEEADTPLLGVDLDRVSAEAQGQAAEGRDLTGREDMLAASDTEVRERLRAEMVSGMADSAYDESVMGGVYVGAVVGALLGLGIFRFQFGDRLWVVLGVAVGLAIVGGLIGYGLGMAVGAGTRAAVRSEKTGQQLLMALGILLFAAPVATVLVVVARWGFMNHLWCTVATWALIAVALFVWAFQDAGYRGMGSGAGGGWGIGCAVFPPLAALYAGRRPKGQLAACPRCNKRFLAVLERCPHCGYRRRAGAPSKEELDLTDVR